MKSLRFASTKRIWRAIYIEETHSFRNAFLQILGLFQSKSMSNMHFLGQNQHSRFFTKPKTSRAGTAKRRPFWDPEKTMFGCKNLMIWFNSGSSNRCSKEQAWSPYKLLWHSTNWKVLGPVGGGKTEIHKIIGNSQSNKAFPQSKIIIYINFGLPRLSKCVWVLQKACSFVLIENMTLYSCSKKWSIIVSKVILQIGRWLKF